MAYDKKILGNLEVTGKVSVGASTGTPTLATDLTTKDYVDTAITTIKSNSFKKVDTTTYATLEAFLQSTGEEGYIYLYPIDQTDPNTNYYQYIWEDSAWMGIGTTIIDLNSYVTTDTQQTITGAKTFNNTETFTKSLAISGKNQALNSYIYIDPEETGNTSIPVMSINSSSSGSISFENGGGVVPAGVGGTTFKFHLSANSDDSSNVDVRLPHKNGTLATTDDLYEEITWANLKAKRDAGELVKGKQYRIIDYQCTTVQNNTSFANHQFDIIVTADNESTLNENARACLHTGDYYFIGNNLAAWELKYCLDNDISKFAWAQIEKNKFLFIHRSGTTGDTPENSIKLYRCPELDNKCSQTANGYVWAWIEDKMYYKDGTTLSPITVYFTHDDSSAAGSYRLTWQSADSTRFDTAMTDIYTDYFANGVLVTTGGRRGGSYGYVASTSGTTYSDGVGTLYGQEGGKGVIYYMKDEFNNECPYDFKNILFTTSGKYTNAYTFNFIKNSENTDNSLVPNMCYNNIIFGYHKAGLLNLNFIVFSGTSTYVSTDCNTFGLNCHDIILSNTSRDNNFGVNCYSISFSSGFYNNSFGESCHDITGTTQNQSNTMMNYCYDITFSNLCIMNFISSSCNNIQFGSSCSYNTVNIDCNHITMGEGSQYNIINNGCRYIKFGNASSTIGYCRNNVIDSGCEYLYITSDTAAAYSNQLQNIHIHTDIKGTSSAYKTITVDRNLSYTIDYYPTGSKSIIVE